MKSSKPRKRSPRTLTDEEEIAIMRNPPKEVYDPEDELNAKIASLVDMIKSSKNPVIITGAGVSTAANIPDYRGVNGLYTKDEQDMERKCDMRTIPPTTTHMIIKELMRAGYFGHLISQNCDGLHLRSGVPQKKLSEIHGNMYIEHCVDCSTHYVRPYEVSFKSNYGQHKTKGTCSICSGRLTDTIVHAGEMSTFDVPGNWKGAQNALKQTNLILLIGTSGTILRGYNCLWEKNVQRVLINTQPTVIDRDVNLKINANCEVVMKRLYNMLGMTAPLDFCKHCDLVLNQGRTQDHEALMNDFTICDCASNPNKRQLQLDQRQVNYGYPGFIINGLPRMRKMYIADQEHLNKIINNEEDSFDGAHSSDDEPEEYLPPGIKRKYRKMKGEKRRSSTPPQDFDTIPVEFLRRSKRAKTLTSQSSEEKETEEKQETYEDEVKQDVSRSVTPKQEDCEYETEVKEDDFLLVSEIKTEDTLMVYTDQVDVNEQGASSGLIGTVDLFVSSPDIDYVCEEVVISNEVDEIDVEHDEFYDPELEQLEEQMEMARQQEVQQIVVQQPMVQQIVIQRPVPMVIPPRVYQPRIQQPRLQQYEEPEEKKDYDSLRRPDGSEYTKEEIESMKIDDSIQRTIQKNLYVKSSYPINDQMNLGRDAVTYVASNSQKNQGRPSEQGQQNYGNNRYIAA